MLISRIFTVYYKYGHNIPLHYLLVDSTIIMITTMNMNVISLTSVKIGKLDPSKYSHLFKIVTFGWSPGVLSHTGLTVSLHHTRKGIDHNSASFGYNFTMLLQN